MLPKLQSSSLAQTLKRENLAFQVQCNYLSLFQVKINLRDFSEDRTTKTINLGKIIMLLRIPTVHLVTSLNNIFLRRKLLNRNMSLDMNWQCQDLWPNTNDQEVTEENVLRQYKKRKHLKSLYQFPELSKRETFPNLNSEGITIELTFQSE